jgi:Mg-chelatase subunit ChlD
MNMITKRIDKTKKVSKALFFVIILLIVPILTNTLTYAQVTTFNNSLSTLNLRFPQEFLTQNFFIRVPNGTITEARMRIQGFDMQGRKGLPADVVLVTDTSGSMSCSRGSPCKITAAQNADKTFLDNVNLMYTHVGLVQYAYPSLTKLNENLTDNGTELRREINNYRADGWTDMGKGMELAMNQLLSSHARSDAPKYIIVMTDGWPNCDATNSDSNCGENYRDGAVDYVLDIANQCAANNIVIYGISFGNCSGVYDSGADCDLMQQITTNGVMYNAPDPTTLAQIYNQIAQQIDVNDFSTPTIRSINPLYRLGWRYPTTFSGDALWNGASCGIGSATCPDFRTLVQDNLAQCTAYPCDIMFSVYSSTVGMLNLSELFIEINEPPVGNYPPIGNCLSLPIRCPQTRNQTSIDNIRLVTDQNDPLNTLTWIYNSLLIESAGGSYFTYNFDYNSTRQLVFTVDPARLDLTFWRTFFFDITDPWGASTQSCINVSYAGCAPPVCGNGPPLELGEQCEFNNTVNNTYCSQTLENCADAPQLRIRDQYGDCNATCGCVNDSWSAPACVINKCGANCTSGTNRTCTGVGIPQGMQYCDEATCNWGLCIPLGRCGDGTLNQPTEQCELNNTINNTNCTQSTINCTNQPQVRTRDLYGNCNATCGCFYDLWSALTCIKGNCSANCTSGTNQTCITSDGYPGNQSCNGITCDWNACISTLYCGDGTVNGTETCERPYSNNNNRCPQSIETCSGARTITRDNLGYCNASCGCSYDSWGPPSCIVGTSCQAVCNDGDYRSCAGGMQFCDSATCDWGPCVPIGICVDNIINNISEQCEPNNNLKNPYCSQENESCTGARLRTRPDQAGYCNAACQCYNDTWSSPTCVANECGAECNAGDTQNCDLGGGIQGIQTCNINTCQWNTCTPLGICGDGIRNQITEQCDYPPAQNNLECSQQNESCAGRLLSTRDSFGFCNNGCTCVADAWSTSCKVDKCGAICDATTQPQTCTTDEGFQGTKSCDSGTCNFGECVPNPIECQSSIPNYLLHTEEPLTISLSDIFDYSGQVTGISDSATHFTITHPDSDHISVSSNDAALETVDITLSTDFGSKSCPVTFLNINSNCDKSGCDCTTYVCLTSGSCLDGEILVTDPYAEVNMDDFLPSRHLDYTVDSFITFDGFGVDPASGDQDDTFLVTNNTNIAHNYADGSKITLTFNDFTNLISGNKVRICPALRRFHYDIGVLGYDPNATLLITGSRAVTGFYERNGFVFSKGPYIFIAKVWLRE